MASMNTVQSSSTPWSPQRRSQRRSIRRAVRVECEVVREHDFKLIASHAVDLSPDGMLVLADARALTGEEVIVSFRTPRSPLWFDACGTIARVVHGRRPGDFGPCLGIRFEDSEEISRIVLGDKLRKLPPPLPRRAARLDYAAMVSSAMA
jgi:hypothetical protein